ncbi:MAG: hypothetical protein NT038_03815 [Euryarchaeota archaeon]|nr:hypothetical protein [Euryarchaeota archaeon]
MFDVFVEQSRLMLTGIIITFVSTLIYKVTPTGFKSAGKYRSKEQAVVIYLAAAVILGLFTPLIYELSKLVIAYVPIVSIVGVFVVSANFIINQSVPMWRHTTPKTLLIYGVGFLLMVLGLLLFTWKIS